MRQFKWLNYVASAYWFVGCGSPRAQAEKPRPQTPPMLSPIDAPSEKAETQPLPFLKGSTHVHTVNSGDSATSVAEVIRWYRENDYDFIVITDHDHVTIAHDDELLVLRGSELTFNPRACSPPPPEEGGKCRLHVNALFIRDVPEYGTSGLPSRMRWHDLQETDRIKIYEKQFALAKKLDGLAQINHPNWHWGMTGERLALLAQMGARFVEIANVQFTVWNQGNNEFPDIEKIWDDALSTGVTVFGIASDDAHHYYDQESRRKAGKRVYPPGGGWVMVRALPNAEAVREAMAKGDFYSSTGVLFESFEYEKNGIRLRVEEREVNYRVIVDGKVVHEVTNHDLEYKPPKEFGYLRVRACAGEECAWTQPLR